MKLAICMLVVAQGLVACGGGSSSEPPPVSPYSGIIRACPLGVPETRIDTLDTQDGIDVVFRTTPTHVAELRGRVESQAAEHGPAAHQGPGHDGMHGLSHDHGMRLWDMPANTATTVETSDGSILSVHANDANKRDDLRAQVRARVQHLESQDCP